MNTTKPGAGALRAAKAILDRDVRQDGPDLDEALARIIDAESGLAELLEAAKDELAALEIWLRGQVEDDIFDGMQISRDKLKAAIAKASNPNATVQQVAPAGRWTEKGTV